MTGGPPFRLEASEWAPPAVFREDLTGERLREAELEENLARKGLTSYEESRILVELAPLVAERLSTETVDKTPRGQKRTYAVPKDAVAAALGVGTMTLVEAEQHVATADAFPVFKQPQWTQESVLTARKCRRGQTLG